MGYSLAAGVIPVVKIGENCNAVYMTDEEWRIFVCKLTEIEQFVDSSEEETRRPRQVYTAIFRDFTVSLNKYRSHCALVLECRKFCVYLGKKSFKSLLKLKEVINCRLGLLTQQEFGKFYRYTLLSASQINPEKVLETINYLCNNQISTTNNCGMLEALNFYPDKVKYDAAQYYQYYYNGETARQ